MDTTGLIVVAAVLALGTVAGVWRRRTDGRFRSVGVPAASGSGPSGPSAPRDSAAGGGPVAVGGGGPAPVAPADLAGAGPVPVAGDDGSGAREAAGDPGAAGERIDPVLLDQLGVRPARATLLQFSSAFCAPCRAVRRVSGEVADLLPGVRHVEVDAESNLDAVRALGIWRTPTLLVLDADGRVAKRATGVPGKAQLIAVLGDLLPAAPR